jgi:two-component system, chemotaxis family, CheB/CheR fusion protein
VSDAKNKRRLKLMEEKLEDALTFSQSIVDATREGLVILDGDLRVVSDNRCFHRTFSLKGEDPAGKLFNELGNHQWDVPELRWLESEAEATRILLAIEEITERKRP